MNYGQQQPLGQHSQVPNYQHQYYYTKGGIGFGNQVHPLQHHHHYAQHGSQHPMGHPHHHGADNSAGLLHQRHQSRSVPSVHDAADIQQQGGENHSSRNSLHETTRLNRSSVSLRGSSMHDDLSSHGMNPYQQQQREPHQHRYPGGDGYQQQQPFSTFMGTPYNQPVHQPGPPCMAHARSQSKKQNQRGVFMRQQSAPDLPPEHDHDNETDVYSEGFHASSGEFRSRSQGNLRRPPPMSRMHSIDADVGYKSEGNSGRYNQGNNPGEIFPYNQALPPNSMPPLHQCIGTMNPMYRRSGGELNVIPPKQRPHSSFLDNSTTPRNNGYLSDGEGYAIRNRRISKSGRYGGSHGSSPGPNGSAVPFEYDSHVESSRKSPYQQHVGIRQRHDTRGRSGKNVGYNSFANERSGDDTRDDEDDDDDEDEEEEEDDGYIRDNANERLTNRQHMRSSGADNPIAVANISTTPGDTDDLDDIEDDADDDEENDDDIDDERDMEDTINEDGTTATAATVVAASVTAAAIKTTKTSNGTKNETDLIVSYSTYQAQTAAIGQQSTNLSKVNRAKIKQNKHIAVTNSQEGTVKNKNDNVGVGGADSSCEELFAATADSTPDTGNGKNSNNKIGCNTESEKSKNSVSKKSGRGSGPSSVKNSRNNSRQGIYSSDQSSAGADQAPLPPPPEPTGACIPASGYQVIRKRRGQMERADSQHSSSGGGGYRSEPGNCNSCGSGGKDM